MSCGLLNEAMTAYERLLILKALGGANGRRSEAARMLGITRKSLWQKLKKHGLLPLLEDDNE